jgi:hypothetical protein
MSKQRRTTPLRSRRFYRPDRQAIANRKQGQLKSLGLFVAAMQGGYLPLLFFKKALIVDCHRSFPGLF